MLWRLDVGGKPRFNLGRSLGDRNTRLSEGRPWVVCGHCVSCGPQGLGLEIKVFPPTV
jgi:hypothetical protein